MNLLSTREKEINALKSKVIPWASEKEELSKKLEVMIEWRKNLEKMLEELDDAVKQTREFQEKGR